MKRFPILFSLSVSTLPIVAACLPTTNQDGPDSVDTAQPDTQSEDTGLDSGLDTGSDTGSDTGVDVPLLDVPSPEEFQALVDNARVGLTQTFTWDAGHLAQLQGEQGTTLYINSNSLLHADGSQVQGEVSFELIELYTKGDMLVADMPSTGRLPNGDIAQLISGGEHFVNATQQGENLQLVRPFYLVAPTENTGGSDDEMGLFRPELVDADLGTAGDFADGAWLEEEATDDEFGINKEGREGEGNSVIESYWLLSSQFGWSNIDRWYSDPRPKTEIHVDVPNGWDDTNCAVYISYDGEPTALAQLDTYDESTELFSEHYGLIPVGLEVHIIFVTETDGQWSYAIEAQTIEEDHVTVFDAPENFISSDFAELSAVITALP